MAQTRWKNRLIRSVTVDPATLVPNPRNWRMHPQAQHDALVGVLSEVGWIQQVIVNERTGNLVDGHLRVAAALERHESSIPVGYIDVSAEEEQLILATLDPLTALAETNTTTLAALLQEVQSGEAAVQAMLSQLAQEEGIVPPQGGEHVIPQQIPTQWQILVLCDDEAQQSQILDRLTAEGLECRALVS